MKRQVVLLAIMSIVLQSSAAVLPARAQSCPELEAVSFALFGPHTVRPGEVIEERAQVMIRNNTDFLIGTFAVGIYLSTDAEITVSDRLLIGGREYLDSLARYGLEAVPGFPSLAIPPDWPVGGAWLGVLIDDQGDIAECSEDNNSLVIFVQVSGSTPSVRHVPGTYATIAEAVTAADPCDTILIGAGEFNEALSVDKNLIFKGAGWDQTILKTNAAPVGIMMVSAAGVVIEDLQFWSWFGEYFVGKAIHAENSTLLVRNCKFVEINQFNIELYGGSLSLDNIEMTRSIGVADIGVRVFNAAFSFRNSHGGNRIDHVFDAREGSAGLIENCVMDGSTVYWAQGVRLMNTALAVIRNNVMIGQHDSETQTTHQPAGIAMHDSSYADISGNEIHNFVYGMYFGTNADAKIYGNTVTDNVYIGIRLNNSWYGYDGSVPDLGGGPFASPGLNIIRDNGNYNAQNNSPEGVYALHNDWGLNTSDAIDAMLYDDNEDGLLGPIVFGIPAFWTEIGEWVAVNPAPDFTIVFQTVELGGFTSLVVGPSGPRLPGGVIVLPPTGPLFYDVATNAVYSGAVRVGVGYDESALTHGEAYVRLYHYEGDQWLDVTTAIDAASNQVFGETSALSPFILVEGSDCCLGRLGDANGLGGDEPTIGDVSLIIDALFITASDKPLITSPACMDEADVNLSSQDSRSPHWPPVYEDITVGDISTLIDYLFITGPSLGLPECL